MNNNFKYFTDFDTINVIKKQYKTWAFKLHPDVGGSKEKMQELNNEYEKALKIAGKINNKNYRLDEEYINIIDALIHLKMENVTIEICGWFIWIYGDTKPYKDQLGKKGLKLRWHGDKKAWYYKPSWYYNKSKNSWDMNKIRDVYGSQVVDQNQKPNNRQKNNNNDFIPALT